MTIADSFTSGVNAIDALYNNRMLRQKADVNPDFLEAELRLNRANAGIASTKERFLPEELRLKNQHQGLVNKYYGPEAQANIDYKRGMASKIPYEIEEQKLKNKYYPQLTESEISARKALADYREKGGSMYGSHGGSVGQKEILGLQRQLQADNPDWDDATANKMASAYLDGAKEFDGKPLPKLSGISQTLIAQIQKRNSTAQ